MRKARCVTFVVAATFTVSACSALTPKPRDTIAKVNPASVAASPAEWDGRQIEMVGMLVWEFENLGLYQDYGTFCRGGERTAIYVNWHNWPGVSRADSRRQVIVRGIFRNRHGVTQPNGTVLLTNASPGPGPLEPGHVIRFLSRPAKPCPKALP